MASPRFCARCGSALTEQANFCANCGHGIKGQVGDAGPPPRVALATFAPWLVPILIFAVVVGYAGARLQSRASAGTANATAIAADGDGLILAPDISSLTPDERVDRLFNRVMTLASAGKDDSVAFFAPMAVNSFAALMPLSVHRRYDLGLILLVSGETAGARAQADTILAEAPTHLLGLALAMRAENAAGNGAEARRLGAKFTASLASERAKGLPEYSDHAPDVVDAIAEAEGRRSSALGRPK